MISIASDKDMSNHEKSKAIGGDIGGVVGGLGGAAAGALAGAAIGSVVPVLGTAVGAILGAGLGMLGSWLGSEAGKAIGGAVSPDSRVPTTAFDGVGAALARRSALPAVPAAAPLDGKIQQQVEVSLYDRRTEATVRTVGSNMPDWQANTGRASVARAQQ